MTSYPTPFGPIEYSTIPSVARDNSYDPRLIVNSVVKWKKAHEDVKLQRPALQAFREAEKRYGHKTRKLKLPPRLRPARAIQVTGSWRSYDLQASLYARDHSRYAPPNVSGHVQGFCIDVDTSQADFGNGSGLICRILLDVGWRRVRSDEPWHFSLGPLV